MAWGHSKVGLEADHAGDVEERGFFTLCYLSQRLGCDGNEDIIKLVLKNCSKIVLKTCSIKQCWWTLHRRNFHLTRSYISSSAVAEGSVAQSRSHSKPDHVPC